MKTIEKSHNMHSQIKSKNISIRKLTSTLMTDYNKNLKSEKTQTA